MGVSIFSAFNRIQEITYSWFLPYSPPDSLLNPESKRRASKQFRHVLRARAAERPDLRPKGDGCTHARSVSRAVWAPFKASLVV